MKRLILSTNDQKPGPPVEPQKLNIITTKIIPEAKPMPEPGPLDPSKMITTRNVDSIVRRQKEAAGKAAAEEAKRKSGTGKGGSQ